MPSQDYPDPALEKGQNPTTRGRWQGASGCKDSDASSVQYKDKHTRTSCSVPLLQRELPHPPITGGNMPSTWLLPLARSMRHKLTWLFPSGTAPLYHRRRVIKSRGTEADTRLERSKSSSGLLGDASKEQRQERGPTLGSTRNASN